MASPDVRRGRDRPAADRRLGRASRPASRAPEDRGAFLTDDGPSASRDVTLILERGAYASQTQSSPRRAAWLTTIVLLILALAIALRVATVGSESLDGDEVYSLRVISQSPSAALELTLDNVVHPPLYLVAAKLVTAAAGADPTGLRLWSLICGTAVVGLTFLVGRIVLGDVRVALLAAALVALSDPQIYYSQQARSYAMYVALVLLFAITLWRALLRPIERGPWVAVFFAAVALVYTHYIGWLYLLATLPVCFLLAGRRGLTGWTFVMGAVGVVFSIWIALVLPRYQKSGVNHFTWVGLPSGRSLGQLFAAFNGLPDIPKGTSMTLLIGGVCAAAALLWALRPREPSPVPRRAASGLLLIGSLAVLPPLLLFVACQPPLSMQFWGDRHLLPSQAAWALVVSTGVFCLARSRMAAATLVVALIALQAAPTIDHMRYPRRLPMAALADYLSRHQGEADAMLTTSAYNLGAPVNVYLTGADSLQELSAESATLPSRFWLVYRPWLPEEHARVQAVQARGWTVAKERYFSRRPSDTYGAIAALLVR